MGELAIVELTISNPSDQRLCLLMPVLTIDVIKKLCRGSEHIVAQSKLVVENASYIKGLKLTYN